MTVDTSPVAPAEKGERSMLRSVAVPIEHGGWGLTAEPVVLGLAVAPGLAGACIGLAAMLAFVARTPLRVVLVDRHRRRDLARTVLARKVLVVEVVAISALVAVAVVTAGEAFWWPVVVAAPLVVVELWFDMRSRSRRLVPELAGTYGICAVAAMILLADGHPTALAIAVWLILAGRATTAIPHVRAQIFGLHGRPTSSGTLFAADAGATAAAIAADAGATAAAIAAVALDPAVAAGAAAVAAVIVFQRATARRTVPAKVIGIRQSVLGLAVVVATAAGIHLT